MPNTNTLNALMNTINPFENMKHREIACLSWTSSTGEVMPVLFKMLDEYGEVQTFNKLRILHMDENRYHGTTIKDYRCELNINGFLVKILIILNCREQRWYLIEE